MLIVTIMGDNGSKFMDMCFGSVIDADKIIFCWGEEDGKTLTKFNRWKEKYPEKFELISLKYDQENKEQNGIQRNFYLKYLKDNYPNEWNLSLDLDEVVEDFLKIRNFIDKCPTQQHNVLWSIKMRHFIQDLGHEDSTQPIHFVQHRMFKIRDNLIYDEVEHPVLRTKSKDMRSANIQPTVIWHLSYIPNLWDYKKKYENHLKKSNIHTKEHLDGWYRAHLFGQYPKSQINPMDIPEIVLKEFGIDKDELYFIGRGLETKHFIMAKQWVRNWATTSVLDIGCGLGHYGFIISEFLDCDYMGIDKSKWAIENTPYKDLNITKGDITLACAFLRTNFDLVLLIDILEHLEEKELDFVLENISKTGKHFIFSIPFKGMLDLDADPTHKIKESKDWWEKKLGEYFKIKPAPEDWMFHEQMWVGEKK